MASSQSTVTLQQIADSILVHGDVKQVLTAGGFNNTLVCTIATDVMDAFCAVGTPWKWNEFQLPPFYLNSWQQDYALNVTNLAWLTDGIGIQINNSSTPKPWSWIEVGRRQGKSTATALSNSFFASPQFTCSYLPNNQLYYGTWGAAGTGNASWGNNPQALQVIANPVSSSNATPANPILQIQDANGNFLVVTSFGTTGNSAPLASPNAAPGTTVSDGSVTWTVIDPYGQGIRVKPVPPQTGPVWQLNLTGQLKPVRFDPTVSLNTQTLFPLTDDYEPVFRQGMIAQTYMYSPEDKLRAKGDSLWARWTQTITSLSIQAAKQQGERERDLDRVIPESSVMGAGSPRVGWVGSAWPYGYPIT